MNDAEAYEFYANPENRRFTGTPRKRAGQQLTSASSVRFAPEVLDAARDLAAREDVTVGSWIRRLVQREIDKASPVPLRTFSCPHLSVGNVTSVACGTCGPLAA